MRMYALHSNPIYHFPARSMFMDLVRIFSALQDYGHFTGDEWSQLIVHQTSVQNTLKERIAISSRKDLPFDHSTSLALSSICLNFLLLVSSIPTLPANTPTRSPLGTAGHFVRGANVTESPVAIDWLEWWFIGNDAISLTDSVMFLK